MATNNEDDHGLEEFIKYAEEELGGHLLDWQRDMLTDIYNRYGALEVHAYVDKAGREYDKVDDELSDLVDELLSSPTKGEPVALDLGDIADQVRGLLGEAEYTQDTPRQLTEAIDADVVKNLDDHALGRLVDEVNDEWSSRGNLTPKDTEQLHTPEYGKPPEADADTRAYAAGNGAYLGALMAAGFNRNEAMAMVMFELQADLARDLHGRY